jgi:phosphinothricin acetyltransferase
MIIRPATLADAPALMQIYNHEILHGVATFDTETKTVDDREKWLRQHTEKYPVLVAVVDGFVTGYASMNRWSDRAAYNDTAEISIYLAPAYQGKGIGKQLMQAILEAGKNAGLHCILSRITEGNDASIYLHKKFGFELVGVTRQVGKKFGRLLDVTMMQLLYDVSG